MRVLFGVDFPVLGVSCLVVCGFFVYWESHFYVSVRIRVSLRYELTATGYNRTRLHGLSVILRNFNLLFGFEFLFRLIIIFAYVRVLFRLINI